MDRSKERSSSNKLNRRKFLQYSSAATVASIFSPLIHANTKLTSGKTLSFINLHTEETLSCCYWMDGKYNPISLAEINHILRDHRANEMMDMNTKLLDLLHTLHQETGSNSPFHVISGYRSPHTNKKLRKQDKGVAKRSLHMQGKAIDIRLPDVELKHLRDTAISLQAGGVGYYSKSNFIHIDIGKPRSW